jgi:hypothetical protein
MMLSSFLFIFFQKIEIIPIYILVYIILLNIAINYILNDHFILNNCLYLYKYSNKYYSYFHDREGYILEKNVMIHINKERDDKYNETYSLGLDIIIIYMGLFVLSILFYSSYLFEYKEILFGQIILILLFSSLPKIYFYWCKYNNTLYIFNQFIEKLPYINKVYPLE